jgi:hypothetical protein
MRSLGKSANLIVARLLRVITDLRIQNCMPVGACRSAVRVSVYKCAMTRHAPGVGKTESSSIRVAHDTGSPLLGQFKLPDKYLRTASYLYELHKLYMAS